MCTEYIGALKITPSLLALGGTRVHALHVHARISFRLHARDLNLVMAPALKGAALPFRVTGAEAYCFTFG